ncbi:alpha/beta hydrolase [Oceanobacillus jeddahense]|uniref:Alpha/beta hydrolase n=1 Tax=Oceanobacillus jeddahense TaxID=1462527 RepID=A0ABY5JQN4_9BACI|nr:alpha/beta fold hydrolase [Oceanobacillus jeddahense]UUI02623.1 alpha/beta hydrolase [Oceanobacillus jeddahense]
MKESKVEFYSDGFKLKGSYYYPVEFDETKKYPTLIINSGYQGFNEFYPKLFAENLTQKGFLCFGFDYRGFADSEGEKGRVLLEEQVRDIQHAINYISTNKNVDANKIGLIGWGMGACNVVHVAAKDKRVKAVAGLNGFYNGERWLRSIHTYVEFNEIEKTLEEDRKLRSTVGESRLAPTFIHYPLDPATKDYVEKELSSVYGFGHETQLLFTDSILETNAENVVDKISPVPLFIGHGTDNLLHPNTESVSLYRKSNSPKQFYWIDGKHNDFMFANHPEFLRLNNKLDEFFKNILIGDIYDESVSSFT